MLIIKKKSFIKYTSLFFFLSFFLVQTAFTALYDPISVYLTWQRDPHTTMTIQWISTKDDKEDLIEYQSFGKKEWQKAQATHTPMPNHYPFLIHRIEITNLNPNTKYKFRINSGVVFKFKTMPEDTTQPIRFVAGGDMYHDDLETLEKTNLAAASYDPHFVLIGGDIAYTSHKLWFVPENAKRWLEWLIAWKNQMVTSDGCLIPLIPAIGNHETNGRFDQTPAQALFFYAFFPMPGSQGYNVLDFSHYLSIFILDSGHTHPIEGKQTDWLALALNQRGKVPHKFAIYHVPAYPSHGSYLGKYSVSIRKNWVPLFELYGLNAAFENHSHTYKRSFPIYKGETHPNGILYIGDGTWGIKKPRIPKTPKQAWYLAKTASVRHFILVTILNKERRFEAIDDNSQVFDHF